MRNKKIISLVCALAMVFSMFAAFTTVNAADKKGMALAGELSEDGKIITLTLSAVGITDKVDNFTLAVNVPEGVTTDENIEVTAMTGMAATTNVADGVLYVICTDPSAKGLALPEDNKLATVKINLGETPLAADYVAKLQPDASIKENSADAGLNVEENTLDAAETTVTKWQDPNKKPDTVARPPKATAAPDQPDVPTPVEPEGKGIALSSSMTGNVITLEAKAVGITDKLDNFTLAINLPAGVTTDENIKVTAMTGMAATTNVADGVLYVICTDPSAKGLALPEDDKIATIEIDLGENALTEPFAFTLQPDASIKENSADAGLNVEEKTMTASSTVVDPNAGPTPAPKNTANLKDYVGAGYENAINDFKAANPDKAVYLTVDVKKDGKPAVYGTDYVAEYPEGTVLTEAQYNDLIHGYTDEDMVDVINGLKFRVLSDGTFTIASTLNGEGAESQLVDPVKDKEIGTSTTPKPVPASIKVTGRVAGKDGDTKKVTVGKNITLTAEVTLPSDAKEISAGDAWGYTIDKDKADTYVEELKAEVDKDEDNKPIPHKYVVKFETLKTVSKLPVVFTYKYIDKNGDKATATATANVQIVKEETDGGNGSGNGSSGNGSGSIAHGTPNVNQSAAINFKDIDTVPWAQDAILALVDKGVINGRDNVTFDPNGTVTRAEFAKMVVLGFGLKGGAPGNFSDVDYTQWYGAYVQTAYANDVISGYDDGTFRPNGLITRQEMAAMISRAIKAANKTLAPTVAAVDFTDVTDADWGKAEIAALQQGGVINGMTATTYEPQSNATRAQAAVIIYRAITKAL